MTVTDVDMLQREIAYYRRLVDEAAGEAVRLDYKLTQAARALTQRQSAFGMLVSAHQLYSGGAETRELVQHVLDSLSGRLGFDRAAILRHAGDGDAYEAYAWSGYGSTDPPRGSVVVPAELLEATGQVIVTKSNPATGGVQHLCEALSVPYLVTAAVSNRTGRPDLLVAGRVSEHLPFNPPLNPRDGETLTSIAEFVAAAQLADEHRALEQRLHARDAERAVAADVQRHLLPADPPVLPGYQLYGSNRQALEIGGDFFDYFMIDEHRCALCLADVSGKGLPASLLVANLQATIRASADFATDPASFLERVNAVVCRSVSGGRFITCFYGVLDLRTHRLRYALAGHNPPLLVEPKGVKKLVKGGLPLGIEPGCAFEQGSVPLHPGSALVVYSDGVVEAMNPRRELYEMDRLIQVALRSAGWDAFALAKAIESDTAAFSAGQRQADDITLLVLSRSQSPT